MQFVVRTRKAPRVVCPRAGFTLIEMLVAISVIGVAVTVFMQMYTASMDLGKLSRNRQLASEIAREQLNLLIMNPSSYVWETSGANADGLFRIRTTADEPRAGMKVEAPPVAPFARPARARQEVVYDQYRWRAFGRLGQNEQFYEVFVDVRWTQSGKDHHLVLTGAVPKSAAVSEGQR